MPIPALDKLHNFSTNGKKRIEIGVTTSDTDDYLKEINDYKKPRKWTCTLI